MIICFFTCLVQKWLDKPRVQNKKIKKVYLDY